uniref:Coiled-coil domain-containing protein n=1 Tax=Steinernema glaseri TaxID=37863 RepID=A0A1I7YGW4_9BILA
MGRVKKPAKGVNAFNVKMSQKSLKKIFKKKKTDAPVMEVEEVEPELTEEQIEEQHQKDTTGEKPQKVNPDRLKKHELPVHVPFNEKFKKGKGKKARKADVVNPSNIVHCRLMTKKKAKKLLRAEKREQRAAERQKQEAEMAMET